MCSECADSDIGKCVVSSRLMAPTDSNGHWFTCVVSGNSKFGTVMLDLCTVDFLHCVWASSSLFCHVYRDCAVNDRYKSCIDTYE